MSNRAACICTGLGANRAGACSPPVLTFELLLGLLALCLVLALVARRLHIPLAVALVLGGMGLAFAPGLPTVELEPELALALFLPPLLQLSAYRTDWPAFRSNLRSILLLAVGAVLFTAVAVALVAKQLVPELPWGAAIALGAIVAPPDAVAAAAVLKELRPPKRVVAVLEGESLLNDASSIVLFRFAVAATLAGGFAWRHGLGQFVLAALGGGAIGWAVGRAAMWVFAKLDDTLHDITVSVLAGFAAYLLAEAAHVSGVLGVVGCGLVLGRAQHHAFTARTRLESAAVWSFIEFVLTALIFMLIGLQLRGIVARLEDYDAGRLALVAGAVSVTLIASRFLWIWPTAWVPRLLSRKLRGRDPAPPAGELAVISWAGMRGVVSLAAALALPLRFPGRDLIVFLAFCAIFTTLVLQGTTLGPLIRRLGVTEPEPAGLNPDHAALRREASEAALAAVEERVDEHGEVAEELADELRGRAEQATRVHEGSDADSERREQQQRLRLEGLEAARAKLAEGAEEETSRALLEELDLEEEQIRRELGERS